MKKLALGLMAAVALGALPFATGAQAAGKTIGYYMDASDDFYKAGFEVFKTLAEREGWTVLDVVGQGDCAGADRCGRELHHAGRRRASGRSELARDDLADPEAG